MSFLAGRTGRVALALACVLAAGAVASAVAYDRHRGGRLAAGLRIAGVDVGGLDRRSAAQRVRERAVEPMRRDLRVHAGTRTFTLPAATLHLTADVDDALARGLAASRRGWIGARIADALAGRRMHENVPLRTHYAPGVIGRVIEQVAASTDRAPVDASVRPDADGLTQTPSRDGLAVDRAGLRRRLVAALLHPTLSADVAAATRPLPARVRRGDLAARYPAYIVIDRKAHELRFYRHLRLARTYDIAVGREGLETPAGLYDIQWKEVNPPWRVPDSAWAGELAGKTIPPGPRDPIKARWMAFNGGAGIHGIDPGEYGSIGHDASHGCVRMRIPDVIALYDDAPVGTPVYVG